MEEVVSKLGFSDVDVTMNRRTTTHLNVTTGSRAAKRPQATMRSQAARGSRASTVRQVIAGTVVVLIAACPAWAQSGQINRLDAYGNARPGFMERRTAGSYQNSVQRNSLAGLQSQRALNRGGLLPFSFSADRTFSLVARQVRARQALMGMSQTAWRPSLMARSGVIPPTKRYAFRRYGGFEARDAADEPEDIHTLLTRSAALRAAHAGSSPIDRAMWRRGNAGELAAYSEGRPALQVEVKELPPEDAPAFVDHVHQRVAAAGERMRRKAWDRMRMGDYRSAMRSFQGSVQVDPSDDVSRVGELFCRLKLGAVQTAAYKALLIARYVDNPFLVRMKLRDRLESPDDMLDIQIEARRFAESNRDRAEATALNVLTLWFVGRRAEAMRLARGLPRLAPNSEFATWPQKMAVAEEALRVTGE